MHVQVARLRVPLIGVVCVAATTYGVVRVHLDDAVSWLEREIREAYPDAVVMGPGPTTAAAGKAIREYLSGGPDPDVRVVLPEEGFTARVWHEIRKIPRGEVRSYSRIAKALRRPGAARAVGQACGKNPVPLLIPCHRVVAADGTLGGFTGDLRVKRRLLELEGATLNGS